MSPGEGVLTTETEISGVYMERQSSFINLIPENQRSVLIPKRCFNSKAVRLESLDSSGIARIALVDFYDFMTSNMIYARELNDSLDLKFQLMSKPHNTFDQVLGDNNLANVIAVSITLEDADGKILVVERGDNVAVGANVFSTACSGSIREEDLDELEPFTACGRRELQEELGIECDLEIQQVVICKNKLQPVVLLKGYLDETFEDLLGHFRNAQDFKEENKRLFAVPKNEIYSIVKCYDFTNVAAFQLAMDCDNWDKVPSSNIMLYLLIES